MKENNKNWVINVKPLGISSKS